MADSICTGVMRLVSTNTKASMRAFWAAAQEEQTTWPVVLIWVDGKTLARWPTGLGIMG